MPETDSLIARILSANTALAEKHHAFGLLVRRYQDMAYGCALAHLGDSYLAEDAAQDAFLTAWQHLAQLRTPTAFPGWLRRLVLTQCHRRTRGKCLPTVPLEAAAHLTAPDDPQATVLRDEQSAAVHAALQTLPEGERLATVLFYIGDYSRSEIAAFLGISDLAVKKRLASARRRLHERMLPLMENNLHEQRPSRDDAFAERVAAFTQGFSELIEQGTSIVRSLANLSESQGDVDFRAAIEQVNQDVQQGHMLSSAMAKHSRFFGENYIKAVRLGEDTATLDTQLQRMGAGEEIFDAEGRVILHGEDDPLIANAADGLIGNTSNYGNGRLRLTVHQDEVNLFFWSDGQWREGWRQFPEVLPMLWEHYRRSANIADMRGIQEGHFLLTQYCGKDFDVLVQVQVTEEGEEMTLTITPQ